MISNQIDTALAFAILTWAGCAMTDLNAWKEANKATPGIAFNWSLAVNRWAASFVFGFVTGLALGSQGSP